MEECIMSLSRRQLSREFKLAALQRLERGSSVGEVARAFEINPKMNITLAPALQSGACK
ncbi:MAG: hypothetical protein FJW26_16390 [Acidimicrobiia bacterium]|nr:hypothetical protein [Acidimicrobiia bacterium]